MQQDSSAPMTQDCVWHWRNSDFRVWISYSILRLARRTTKAQCLSSQASHCLHVSLPRPCHILPRLTLAQHMPVQRVGPAMLGHHRLVQRASPAMLAQHRDQRIDVRKAHERRVRPVVQPPLSPISMPAILPEDNGNDLSSSPCVKRRRQRLASSSRTHSQSGAPLFDPGACGNHLEDRSRKGPKTPLVV